MRRILAAILVAVFVLGFSTTAFASIGPRSPGGWAGPGWGMRGSGWMMDYDGSLLNEEAFAQRLDEAIASGFINESQRQGLLEMREWCLAGGWCGGARGWGARGRW